MVLTLFLIDTVHSISAIYMAWVYCVTNYNNPTAITSALWPYTFTPIATALAALLTQIFLGYRIYRLSSSRILFGIIIVLAIPSFALGMTCGIKAWIIKLLVKLPVLDNLVTAWLAMQVSIDLFITGTLTIILTRSRTGFHKTDTVLNRLIRGAIQTGLFAGIFSLGDLITFLRYPETNLYGMFAIPIGRIYTNTLLDTLLARHDLRLQMAGTRDMDSDTNNGASWQSSQRSKNIQLKEVEVRKDVQVFNDAASYEADVKVPTSMAI